MKFIPGIVFLTSLVGCENAPPVVAPLEIEVPAPEVVTPKFAEDDEVILTFPDGTEVAAIVVSADEDGTYTAIFVIERELNGSVFTMTMTVSEIPEHAMARLSND